MRVSDIVGCETFPCDDLNQEAYRIPDIDLSAESMRIVMIAEVPPADPLEDLYAGNEALNARTTLQAFADAGLAVGSIDELIQRGIYLTTAVKCGKCDYTLKAGPIRACSHLLEQELALFPSIKAYLLMGDVAIRAMNEIARRRAGKRVIPAGSTYRIRHEAYYMGDARVYPSYLQAGKSFFIERSKREMIAEDIKSALALAGIS